ncbi:TPA: MATE family efflux transporter [Clostridioides difficile]|nr:MATE family efflux transporter [Clostridioides difficile]MDE3610813.1 MATE family efflux transporter [Clostridioides difficile]MDM9791819.1 MATE family efflux transporter [Clostridioides difficile]HBG7262683.1 MATE family efflux transporter [Clostridioides difficile]HBG7270184.1 MATE family efflux transporter [Clostridioides difficile]
MNIQISDHFNYNKLLRFALPSIIMMVFSSLYSVVDGFFVSNIAGKTSFAAVNLIVPVIMILASNGFMFGAGGSALISKTMGEGDNDKAKRLFSLFVYSIAISGIIISIIGFIFIRPIAILLGANGTLLEDCVLYGRILLFSMPFFMLQFGFQSFFVTAGKPNLGLVVTLICGITNMVLDALFMAVFSWGIAGAAIATAISQILGGIIPLIYFSRDNSSLLRLTKTSFDGKALLKACTNGSSELMTNISTSVVSILYNAQLMKYAGENGIAAYGVLMYVNMIFAAVFLGYSTGTAPIVSYHFGAKNHSETKGLLKKSISIITVFSICMFILAELTAKPLSAIFISYDTELLAMTIRAFRIFSFSFLFAGIAVYGSAFFTALNDGLTSALISFLRTLLFKIVAALILPIFWGIDGIWVSIVAAELASFFVTILFLKTKRRKFNY